MSDYVGVCVYVVICTVDWDILLLDKFHMHRMFTKLKLIKVLWQNFFVLVHFWKNTSIGNSIQSYVKQDSVTFIHPM